MVRLAVLLIGADAVRRQWPWLAAMGALWIAVGALVFLDASSGVLGLATEVLGALFAIEGAVALAGAWAATPGARSALAWRGVAFILFGLLIADVLVDHGLSDSILFGLAFLLDGALRIASAAVVRFERWRTAIAAACVELVLAGLILADWPWPYRLVIPYCMSVALATSGLTLVRLGLQLRALPAGGSVTQLPMFRSRPWHSRRTVEAAQWPEPDGSEVLTLYVWTPMGAIESPLPRPVVSRYIAAVDRSGVVSTGHAAVELAPDVYISLYPAIDIDHSPDDFAKLLRAGTENDVPGRWNESHDVEVARWRPPDRRVRFRRFNATALRRFWQEYQSDTTYNLTSRSCSTATSLALECALEGSLGQRHPWRAFFALIVDPYVWLAAMLRHRGATMAWTPGLVLDYARALRRVVEERPSRDRRRRRIARREATVATTGAELRRE